MTPWIELRTGIPKLWSQEGQREVFSCLGEFQVFIQNILRESEEDIGPPTDEQFRKAFSAIDENSSDITWKEGELVYTKPAILLYTWERKLLVDNICRLWA